MRLVLTQIVVVVMASMVKIMPISPLTYWVDLSLDLKLGLLELLLLPSLSHQFWHHLLPSDPFVICICISTDAVTK